MEWWPKPSRKCHLMTSLLTAAYTALSASCQQLTHFSRFRVRLIIYTELKAQLPLQTAMRTVLDQAVVFAIRISVHTLELPRWHNSLPPVSWRSWSLSECK